MKKTSKMTQDEFMVDGLAERIADEIFLKGEPDQAHRLVIERLDKKQGGGWCYGAVKDIIVKHLKGRIK